MTAAIFAALTGHAVICPGSQVELSPGHTGGAISAD